MSSFVSQGWQMSIYFNLFEFWSFKPNVTCGSNKKNLDVQIEMGPKTIPSIILWVDYMTPLACLVSSTPWQIAFKIITWLQYAVCSGLKNKTPGEEGGKETQNFRNGHTTHRDKQSIDLRKIWIWTFCTSDTHTNTHTQTHKHSHTNTQTLTHKHTHVHNKFKLIGLSIKALIIDIKQ